MVDRSGPALLHRVFNTFVTFAVGCELTAFFKTEAAQRSAFFYACADDPVSSFWRADRAVHAAPYRRKMRPPKLGGQCLLNANAIGATVPSQGAGAGVIVALRDPLRASE